MAEYISFLGRRLYYSAASHHWEKLGDRYMVLFIATACEFTIILKQKMTEVHTVSLMQHQTPNSQADVSTGSDLRQPEPSPHGPTCKEGRPQCCQHFLLPSGAHPALAQGTGTTYTWLTVPVVPDLPVTRPFVDGALLCAQS